MRLRSATKQKERHQKKVQFNQSAKKVVTNDSIGTFSPGLYILYFLKLPAPPRADLSGIIYIYISYMHINQILFTSTYCLKNNEKRGLNSSNQYPTGLEILPEIS